MTHNDKVFDGHEDDAEDVCHSQQYSGNRNLKLIDFSLKILGQVLFSGQHGKG